MGRIGLVVISTGTDWRSWRVVLVLVLSVQRSATSIVLARLQSGPCVKPVLVIWIVWAGYHWRHRGAILVRCENWSPRTPRRSIIVRVVWSGDHWSLWSSITVRVWSVDILLRRERITLRSPG